MTADEVLIELIDCLASVRGNSVMISNSELANWPADIVSAVMAQGLLSQTRPAKSTVCPGCERDCVMPLHFMSNLAGHSQALIVCDKRDDDGGRADPVPHQHGSRPRRRRRAVRPAGRGGADLRVRADGGGGGQAQSVIRESRSKKIPTKRMPPRRDHRREPFPTRGARIRSNSERLSAG